MSEAKIEEAGVSVNTFKYLEEILEGAQKAFDQDFEVSLGLPQRYIEGEGTLLSSFHYCRHMATLFYTDLLQQLAHFPSYPMQERLTIAFVIPTERVGEDEIKQSTYRIKFDADEILESQALVAKYLKRWFDRLVEKEKAETKADDER